MKRYMIALAAFAAIIAVPSAAQTEDAAFLRSLDGEWSGSGPVRMRPDASPLNVSCTISTDTSSTALSMDGSCTSLAIFSRRIGAEIRFDGSAYSGSYEGSARGTAKLAGNREGRSLNLALDWPHRPPATMRLDSPSENRMVLTTVEQDPKTGEDVVTAQLELTRE